MKTKLEIIDETVKYYSEDVTRRAVPKEGGCYYHVFDQGMDKYCAFGRCMIDPKISVDDTSGFNESQSIIGVDQDLLLKEEYRGHSNRFWIEIQRLHDNDVYWGSDGLSADGLRYSEELKSLYK